MQREPTETRVRANTATCRIMYEFPEDGRGLARGFERAFVCPRRGTAADSIVLDLYRSRSRKNSRGRDWNDVLSLEAGLPMQYLW
jgi:hypothetical protein